MKKFGIFLAVCFGISLLSAGLFHFLGGDYASVFGSLFASAYMFIPLVSVVLTQLLVGEKPFYRTGVSFKFNRWWVVALFSMPLFCLLTLPVSAIFPGVSIDLNGPLMVKTVDQMAAAGLKTGPIGVLAITMVSGLIAGLTINAVFAFGEEIAWRGFLARCLDSLGFWRKSLLIGAAWGAWHAPLILMGHNYPSHPVSGVFMMIAFCILLTPVFMLLREKAGSMIVAAIAHGTMNAVAGIALMCLDGYDEMLCGACGLAGMLILAVTDLVIFLVFREYRATRTLRPTD